MTSFVVMTPPADSGSEALPEFVRDGFSVVAFIVPPLWLLWHRLWIEAGIAFGVMALIPSVAWQLGFGPVSPWLSMLVSLYAGLEGPQLRLAALRAKGWTDAGVYEADDLVDAETRFAAQGAR